MLGQYLSPMLKNTLGETLPSTLADYYLHEILAPSAGGPTTVPSEDEERAVLKLLVDEFSAIPRPSSYYYYY